MAKYDSGRDWSLQLNVLDVFDALSAMDQTPPVHVVPGNSRTALLTLNYRVLKYGSVAGRIVVPVQFSVF